METYMENVAIRIIMYLLAFAAVATYGIAAHAEIENCETYDFGEVVRISFANFWEDEEVAIAPWANFTGYIDMEATNITSLHSGSFIGETNYTHFFFETPSPLKIKIEGEGNLSFSDTTTYEGNIIQYENGEITVSKPDVEKWEVGLYLAKADGEEYLFNGSIEDNHVKGNVYSYCLSAWPIY